MDLRWRDLDATLTAVAAGSPARTDAGFAALVRFDADRDLHAGLETRNDPRAYRWDGRRRGGNALSPAALLQYTVDGAGRLEVSGRRYELAPGKVFAAIIPSDHCYYLPSESPGWRFFWLMLRHPYAVARLAGVLGRDGPVLAAPTGSPLATHLASLFEGVFRSRFRDVYAWELEVLAMVLEWQRAADQVRYPQTPRQRLLDGVRQDVLRRLNSRLDVAWLAERRGMSRTAFSHRFREQTGLSPAAYALEVRLEESVRRLLQTDDKVAAIAAETGFVDANHFCRVFRKHYRTSPGAYRQQMR